MQVKKKPFKGSEFNVALKTISLLYFMQLCLLSLPFLPFNGVLIPVLLLINFRCEKWVLFWAQSKPRKNWSATDAGAFFIQFYLISILIGFVFLHAVLATYTLPKLCSVQVSSLPVSYTSLDMATLQSQDSLCYNGE